jgi:hypothetical protein
LLPATAAACYCLLLLLLPPTCVSTRSSTCSISSSLRKLWYTNVRGLQLMVSILLMSNNVDNVAAAAAAAAAGV